MKNSTGCVYISFESPDCVGGAGSSSRCNRGTRCGRWAEKFTRSPPCAGGKDSVCLNEEGGREGKTVRMNLGCDDSSY
jgi:hypothetical protein